MDRLPVVVDTAQVVAHQPVMSFDLLLRQADILASSRIIPRAYQGKSSDIVAAGLAGFSFGWDVMTSLRNYHVIEGTASLRPEAMLGLVRRHGHSVSLTVGDVTVDGQVVRVATAHGRRRDNGDEHTATFDTDDARRAGLLGKSNWKHYEDAMLTWRAVSALCRVLFPDVVLGAGYVPEELGATVTDTGEVIDVDPLAVEYIPAAQAKTRLLEACQGDKDQARTIWGDRGSNPVTADDLDVMLSDVEWDKVHEAVVVPEITTTSQQTDIVSTPVDDDDDDLGSVIELALDTNTEQEKQ